MEATSIAEPRDVGEQVRSGVFWGSTGDKRTHSLLNAPKKLSIGGLPYLRGMIANRSPNRGGHSAKERRGVLQALRLQNPKGSLVFY